MNELWLLAEHQPATDDLPWWAPLVFLWMVGALPILIYRTTEACDDPLNALAAAVAWPLLAVIGITRYVVVLAVKTARGEEW